MAGDQTWPIESFFGVGFISYHLIEFSREALRGEQNASFYSTRARDRLVETDAASHKCVKCRSRRRVQDLVMRVILIPFGSAGDTSTLSWP
jgi:hypothetical protein